MAGHFIAAVDGVGPVEWIRVSSSRQMSVNSGNRFGRHDHPLNTLSLSIDKDTGRDSRPVSQV